MNLKKAHKIFLTLISVMVVLPFILNSIFPSLYPLWIVLLSGLGSAAIFVDVKFWRCPHCGKNLGYGIPKYCSNCGHRLDELL